MIKALREIVVTKLRHQGFKGSFPHFRRSGNENIDLLTFQFDRYGGGFVIEISRCPVDGITTCFREHIPPDKVIVWNMGYKERVRLQL